MNHFIESVYTFNKLGGCSQDQSYRNFIGGLELIEEETHEMEDTFMKFLKDNQGWSLENKADFLDSLVDLLVVSIGAGYRVGLTRQQIELAMSVVAEENLNKYCKTEEDALQSIEQYKDDDRYSDVHYEIPDIDGEVYYAVIGMTEQGTRKILKGIHWSDPKEKLKDIIKG